MLEGACKICLMRGFLGVEAVPAWTWHVCETGQIGRSSHKRTYTCFSRSHGGAKETKMQKQVLYATSRFLHKINVKEKDVRVNLKNVQKILFNLH